MKPPVEPPVTPDWFQAKYPNLPRTLRELRSMYASIENPLAYCEAKWLLLRTGFLTVPGAWPKIDHAATERLKVQTYATLRKLQAQVDRQEEQDA